MRLCASPGSASGTCTNSPRRISSMKPVGVKKPMPSPERITWRMNSMELETTRGDRRAPEPENSIAMMASSSQRSCSMTTGWPTHSVKVKDFRPASGWSGRISAPTEVASAGAPFIEGAYIVTTVFRLGGVDVGAAERFEYEEPEAFKAIDREAKRLIGGSWDKWWQKTPLPGVAWCNYPHMANYNGLKVDDLTRADLEGRKRIAMSASCRPASATGVPTRETGLPPTPPS